MALFPLYNTDGTAQAPLGFPMCQNRLAVPMWSYAMEVLPPARIIELGTLNGGFTTALAVHAWNIGTKVITYDRALPDEKFTPLGRFLGIEYRTGDIWALEQDIAANIALPGTTFMLCDGGDKPRELGAFATYLKPGDVIAAHDHTAPDGPKGPPGELAWWPWREIFVHQGQAVAHHFGLEPWMQDHFDMAGWLVYRKT